MTRKLACKESIADLWGEPYCTRPGAPSTEGLLKEISREAEMCLKETDWFSRIRRIENILTVIKARMRRHWEECHASDLDGIFKKVKEVKP